MADTNTTNNLVSTKYDKKEKWGDTSTRLYNGPVAGVDNEQPSSVIGQRHNSLSTIGGQSLLQQSSVGTMATTSLQHQQLPSPSSSSMSSQQMVNNNASSSIQRQRNDIANTREYQQKPYSSTNAIGCLQQPTTTIAQSDGSRLVAVLEVSRSSVPLSHLSHSISPPPPSDDVSVE